MSTTRPLLIQVVAQLKPGRCGVSDHALLLAQELEAAFGIETAFAVVNSSAPCETPFRRVYCGQPQLQEACTALSQGQAAAVLVHLSGYGFSRDGAPAELAAALERVREEGHFRTAVYFHELYATGMPWRSAFWHSRRQQRAVGRIARECDLLVTNIGRHAAWLERQAPRRSQQPVRVLPVFSNVGEAETLVPMAEREPVMAIYGLAATRRHAYEQISLLAETLCGLGTKGILDIGPGAVAPAEAGGIPVRRMGEMSATELGQTLSRARYGFVQHGAHCMAKSGVLAGLCAWGVVPLIAKPFVDEYDGLRDGIQVISPQTAAGARGADLESCSQAAWRWYAAHGLRAHASMYRDWLLSGTEDADSGGPEGSTAWG